MDENHLVAVAAVDREAAPPILSALNVAAGAPNVRRSATGRGMMGPRKEYNDSEVRNALAVGDGGVVAFEELMVLV